MNPRPPAPKAGALPGCATPRCIRPDVASGRRPTQASHQRGGFGTRADSTDTGRGRIPFADGQADTLAKYKVRRYGPCDAGPRSASGSPASTGEAASGDEGPDARHRRGSQRAVASGSIRSLRPPSVRLRAPHRVGQARRGHLPRPRRRAGRRGSPGPAAAPAVRGSDPVAAPGLPDSIVVPPIVTGGPADASPGHGGFVRPGSGHRRRVPVVVGSERYEPAVAGRRGPAAPDDAAPEGPRRRCRDPRDAGDRHSGRRLGGAFPSS